MKELSKHIYEKLHLTKNIVRAQFKYFPKNNIELCNIVSDIIVEYKHTQNPNTVVDLNCIDTSKITDMSMVFVGPDPVNVDISQWNTSRVKNFELMFGYCSELLSVGDLSKWDVSNAISMKQMFYCCKKLTELNGLDAWRTSKLQDTSDMFFGCQNLEEINDLTDFDMSQITTVRNMFAHCKKLKYVGDISKWKLKPSVDKNSIFTGTQLNTNLNISKHWK